MHRFLSHTVVVVLTTVLMASSRVAADSVVMPEDFDPRSSPGATEGACYDPVSHVCSCDEDVCSEDKCNGLCRVWTSECSSIENCASCTACDAGGCPQEECASSESSDEDDEPYGCYDPTVHTCGCTEDRCNESLCTGLGFFWTTGCSSPCTSCAADGYIDYDATGLGACYDSQTHVCGCQRYECTEAKCVAKGADRFIWSTQCSISCDADTCPEEDDCKGGGDTLSNLIGKAIRGLGP